MEEWINGCVGGWMEEWMDESMDGRLNGWIDGWKNGLMDLLKIKKSWENLKKKKKEREMAHGLSGLP